MHFLHLLGLDTHGHAFRPDSRPYLETLERVDRGVRRAVEAMEARCPDGRTAYLFTSDHGMSDKVREGEELDRFVFFKFHLRRAPTAPAIRARRRRRMWPGARECAARCPAE